MKDPILSVIVPVYNVRAFLPACLDSLTGQTLTRMEILCIDDGSQDGSAEVILSYQEKDPRIKLFRQEHQGVSAARNLGICQARGTYVAFVDSDDWVDPELYQKMVAAAEETQCDMVVCGAEVHPEHPENCDPDVLRDLQARLTVAGMDWQDSDDIGHMWKLMDCPGVWPFIWNKVVRRSCILENHIAFSSDLALGEDGVFIQALLLCSKNIVFLPGPVYHYRYLRKDSAMSRLFQEEDIRFGHHLDVLRVLFQTFSDRKQICIHGSWLLKWTIRFLYFSFVNLPAKSRRKYAFQLKALLQKFSLDQHRKELPFLKQRRISNMLSVHQYDVFRKLTLFTTIAEDKFFQWF